MDDDDDGLSVCLFVCSFVLMNGMDEWMDGRSRLGAVGERGVFASHIM